MKKNRRNFLKFTGLAGLTVAGGGMNTSELHPPVKCFFLRSPDKGKTWEHVPTVIENPHGEKLSITRHNTPVIRMPDGKTLLASFHVNTFINTGDGKELGGEKVITKISAVCQWVEHGILRRVRFGFSNERNAITQRTQRRHRGTQRIFLVL